MKTEKQNKFPMDNEGWWQESAYNAEERWKLSKKKKKKKAQRILFNRQGTLYLKLLQWEGWGWGETRTLSELNSLELEGQRIFKGCRWRIVACQYLLIDIPQGKSKLYLFFMMQSAL